MLFGDKNLGWHRAPSLHSARDVARRWMMAKKMMMIVDEVVALTTPTVPFYHWSHLIKTHFRGKPEIRIRKNTFWSRDIKRYNNNTHEDIMNPINQMTMNQMAMARYGLQPNPASYVHPAQAGYAAAAMIHGQGTRKNATRESTQQLKMWLNEHQKNPYPTKAEKVMLAILSGNSISPLFKTNFIDFISHFTTPLIVWAI